MRTNDDACLTVAAGKALDEHLDDLRHRVIREASRGLRHSAGMAETRAAIARLALADRIVPRPVFDLISMLARPPYAAVFLGVTLSVALAAATAVMSLADLAISPLSGALFGAMFGMVMTVLVSMVLGLTHTRRSRANAARSETAAQFLQRIGRLEEQAAGVCGHRLSLRHTVNALVELGLWTKEDALAFGRLLRMRNALLDEETAPPSQTDLLAMMLEIDRLAHELTV